MMVTQGSEVTLLRNYARSVVQCRCVHTLIVVPFIYRRVGTDQYACCHAAVTHDWDCVALWP